MSEDPRPLRRQRPAWSGLIAVLIACALITASVNTAAGSTRDSPIPQLPTAVNAPGAWSSDENRPGPIAAIGLAMRIIPVGILDAHERLTPFATSALDGSSSWLDLPGFSLDRSGLVGGVAVSPDGRWLGWVRAAKRRGIKGWSIKDTTTGVVRNLDVEGYARVRPTMSELAFSGDSRYLLTSYETPDQPRNGRRNHQFVAWDISDGAPTVLEKPGFLHVPSLGSAEHGVVWSRNRQVFRADPSTGHISTATLPRDVWMASWAPGDAAFAYIGREVRKKGGPLPEERLYVGATPSEAHRVVELPNTSPIGESLAWRDANHVVVGNYRGGMYVVDVSDGSYETIDLGGSGEQLNTPLLATQLWGEPLRPPVAPIGTSDPRRPWRWVGIVLFVALLGAGAFILRRADRMAEARTPRFPVNYRRQT